MFIEVVHANGLYNAAAGEHTNPMAQRGLLGLAHFALNDAIENGADVLYKPNYGWPVESVVGDPQAYEQAVRSDPLLNGLSSLARGLIAVFPDGAGRTPARRQGIEAAENDLASRNELTVVLGAFTSVCVRDAAEGIKGRLPGAVIAIDPQLSVNFPHKHWLPSEAIPRVNLVDHLSPGARAWIAPQLVSD